MGDHLEPTDPLSDGLLLHRGGARWRSDAGVSDDRDDVYLLQDVGDPKAAPSARAVVRRVGDHARLSHMDGPPILFSRLVNEICDALRADGVRTLSAGPELPEAIAQRAGVSSPVWL